MIAMEQRRVASGPAPARPPLPREHGAWGILLVPFATAVGVSGVFDWKVALLLASVLSFYVARASFLKNNLKWTVRLLAGCAVFCLPLLVFGRLWWLAVFGAAAAPLSFRKTQRSAAAQLLAVGGLTLTAPAAWYAATGRIDAKAFWLWTLNALYFGGGVFYVKMHVAAALRRKPFETLAERLRIGAGTLFYYAGAMACLLLLAAGSAVPAAVIAAYLPATARAAAGVVRLTPTLRIKRLGWTEVAYSIAFAAGLIAVLQWTGWGGQ